MILLGSSDTGAIKYLKAIKFNRNIKIKLIKNKNEVNKIKKYKKKNKNCCYWFCPRRLH